MVPRSRVVNEKGLLREGDRGGVRRSIFKKVEWDECWSGGV